MKTRFFRVFGDNSVHPPYLYIVTTIMAQSDVNNTEVVTIHYDDLVSACNIISSNTPNVLTAEQGTNFNIDKLIEQAFGSSPTSLGILAITGIPTLPSLRLQLLPLAKKLADLPPSQLDEMTIPEAEYQVGWSHGREKVEGDKLDLSKGSFYANPLTENLVESLLQRRRYFRNLEKESGSSRVCEDVIDEKSESGVRDRNINMEELHWDESIQSIQTDEELHTLARCNPAFFAPNVWPNNSIPELETTFKEVGRLVHEVGTMVAKCCDSYVAAHVSFFVFFRYFKTIFIWTYCQLAWRHSCVSL